MCPEGSLGQIYNSQEKIQKHASFFEEFRQVSRSEAKETGKERKMFNEINFTIYTLHCLNTRTDAATRFHVTQERRNKK
jgi:hypothetical protein